MSLPLVSVLMPVFNGEKYLRDAVESILAQTYRPFELIVVDDGSKDHSLNILKEYQAVDNRIQICCHPNNMGVVAALNTGIEHTRGEYVARMDADDISLPKRLEKQVSFLEAHPEIGLVGSFGEMIKANGSHLIDISMPASPVLILWSFCFYNPILHPSVCMRRSLVFQAGGYRNLVNDGEKGFPEDYDLWVRMIRLSGFSNLPEHLVKLRQHDTNLTNTDLNTILQLSAEPSHLHIEYVLGREVPSEYVDVFWKKELQKSSVQPAIDLMDEIVKSFIKFHSLTGEERRAVKADAAWRLIKIYPRHIFTSNGVPLLWHAFLDDPLFLLVDSFRNSFPILRLKLYRSVQRARLNKQFAMKIFK